MMVMKPGTSPEKERIFKAAETMADAIVHVIGSFPRGTAQRWYLKTLIGILKERSKEFKEN